MPEKILVVDDDPDILKAVSIRLKAAGYEVVTASDAMQAIMKAHRESPDAMVLDFMMPAGGGMAVLNKLAMSSDTAAIPVVVLTASPRFDLEDEMKNRGVRHFLRKPYDPEELLKSVRKCLGEEPEE